VQNPPKNRRHLFERSKVDTGSVWEERHFTVWEQCARSHSSAYTPGELSLAWNQPC
jgi:hypothetical protein